MDYDKILALSSDNKVELGLSFKEEINKRLCLGMTRYVVRHGSLSEGHEKLTDAQRYYQAIKEMWYIGNSITEQKVLAMMAQADLMDAEEALEQAEKPSQKLRAEAKVLSAKRQLTTCLVGMEDSMRQLDEFNKVRMELRPIVEAQYPEGIEQAEEDNWKTVARYRIMRRNMGHQENLSHIPMDKGEKAKLGLETNNPELVAWQAVTDETKLNTIVQETRRMIEERK